MEVPKQEQQLDRWHSSPFLYLVAGLGKIITFRAMVPEVPQAALPIRVNQAIGTEHTVEAAANSVATVQAPGLSLARP